MPSHYPETPSGPPLPNDNHPSRNVRATEGEDARLAIPDARPDLGENWQIPKVIKVKEGDTVWSLAVEHNLGPTGVEDIKRWNPDVVSGDSMTIKIGDYIRIPVQPTWTLQDEANWDRTNPRLEAGMTNPVFDPTMAGEHEGAGLSRDWAMSNPPVDRPFPGQGPGLSSDDPTMREDMQPWQGGAENIANNQFMQFLLQALQQGQSALQAPPPTGGVNPAVGGPPPLGGTDYPDDVRSVPSFGAQLVAGNTGLAKIIDAIFEATINRGG